MEGPPLIANLFLRCTGLLFTLYGGYLYLDPQYLIDLLELGNGAPARVELRAMYGGLQLAMGVFLILATFRDAGFRQTALAVSVALFAGLASARAAGLIIDGVDSYNLYACIYEAASLVVAIWLLQRAPAQE